MQHIEWCVIIVNHTIKRIVPVYTNACTAFISWNAATLRPFKKRAV